MEKHSSLRDSVERARHYGAVARDALGVFGDTAEKRALLELVDFAIARSH
jgi:octaprenyl-diphosphate synthase